MILVEVYIHIIAEVAVVVPFDMEPETVDTEIPISYLLVVGDVPMYYYDNQGKPVGSNGSQAPAIALPSGHSGVSSGGGVTSNPANPSTSPPAPTQQQTPPGSTQEGVFDLEHEMPEINGTQPNTNGNH